MCFVRSGYIVGARSGRRLGIDNAADAVGKNGAIGAARGGYGCRMPHKKEATDD